MPITIGKYRYSVAKFYRVKVKVGSDAGSFEKLFWARTKRVKKGKVIYVECTPTAGQYFWKGNTAETRIFIGQPNDIIYEKIARVNLDHGTLEVVPR